MHSKILDIRSLCIQIPSQSGMVQPVHELSFFLERGKTLGLVGESGSGKSITSLAIMGLLPPKALISKGEILSYSNPNHPENLLLLREKEKTKYRGRSISMIFQEPMTSLNPSIRCGNQIMEVIQTHQSIKKKEAFDQVLSLLREVKLPDPQKVFQSYPHQLSGGQKQRVMIAMALACKPDILIADEPTTALDVSIQKSILELLKKIQSKYGLAILFISHDLNVVAQLSDRICILQKGRIVEEGPPEKLFGSPKHPYTKALLACRPSLHGRDYRLPTISDIEQDPISIQSVSLKKRSDTRPAMGTTPFIEIKDLVVEYSLRNNSSANKNQLFTAIDHVSLNLFKGETLGLVGESGCGKTSLGRSILGLVQTKSGDILYNGSNLTQLSQSQFRPLRCKLQIIFQDPYASLNPRLSIGEAIIEPMRVHQIGTNEKERREKAIDLLRQVNLDENIFVRYPHEFSGGQRQRICIARALALNPELIICDESVSALDVSVQAQVLNLLNDLKEQYKFTYLFISHDLSVVKYMSDRIAVMQAGKLIECRPAEELYLSPESAYTKMLLDSIPKAPFPLQS